MHHEAFQCCLSVVELQITSLHMHVSVPVHVHVLVRSELPPAQEAGPRWAARPEVARRRPADHLLEHNVTWLSVVLDEDLQPDDDIGSGSCSSPQLAAVCLCPEVLLMDANNVVFMMISTIAVNITSLLPEVEDASLDPWKHGGARGGDHFSLAFV